MKIRNDQHPYRELKGIGKTKAELGNGPVLKEENFLFEVQVVDARGIVVVQKKHCSNLSA